MKIALCFFALAVAMWIASMVADPYTAWGVEHEQVRPGVAHLSVAFASAALILALIAGAVAFWRNAWTLNFRRVAFAVFLLFFGGTAFVRIIWIQFFVLA